LSKERDLKAKLKSTSSLTHLVKEWPGRALTLRNSSWLQQMSIYIHKINQKLAIILKAQMIHIILHYSSQILGWVGHEKGIPPAGYF
jgi:hypothetical protein